MAIDCRGANRCAYYHIIVRETTTDAAAKRRHAPSLNALQTGDKTNSPRADNIYYNNILYGRAATTTRLRFIIILFRSIATAVY